MGGKLPVKTDRRSTSVSFYLTVTVTVLEYEPHLALFVDNSTPLLFYDKIVTLGTCLLKVGGELWFEINERFEDEVVSLMNDCGFARCEAMEDLNGKKRFVHGTW